MKAHTVGKWEVGILLECFLVKNVFHSGSVIQNTQLSNLGRFFYFRIRKLIQVKQNMF